MKGLGKGLLMLVGALAWAVPPVPGEGEKWLEVRTAHFRVDSGLSRGATESLAEELERFHAGIRRVLGDGNLAGGADRPEVPVRVHLFSDTRTYSQYVKSSFKTAGFCMELPDGIHLALDGGRTEEESILRHEYMHFHIARILGHRKMSPWVNEGLACFFERISFQKDTIMLGRPAGHRLNTLFYSVRMKVQELVSLQNISHGMTDEMATRYYASAWLLVHYLNVEAQTRKGQLNEYVGRVAAGMPEGQAFREAFKCTPEEMDQEVGAYAQRIRRGVPGWLIQSDTLAVAKERTVRPLGQAERLARLGFLSQPDPDRAMAHFQRALELDPGCMDAKVGWAWMRWMKDPSGAGDADLEQMDFSKRLDLVSVVAYPLLSTPGGARKVQSLVIQAADAGLGDFLTLEGMLRLGLERTGKPEREQLAELEAFRKRHPAWDEVRRVSLDAHVKAGQLDQVKAILDESRRPDDEGYLELLEQQRKSLLAEGSRKEAQKATEDWDATLAFVMDCVDRQAFQEGLDRLAQARQDPRNAPHLKRIQDMEAMLKGCLKRQKPVQGKRK